MVKKFALNRNLKSLALGERIYSVFGKQINYFVELLYIYIYMALKSILRVLVANTTHIWALNKSKEIILNETRKKKKNTDLVE